MSLEASGSEAGDLAAKVRPQMTVFTHGGIRLGRIASVDHDRIFLASDDDARSPGFLPMSLVEAVDGNRVCLRARGDANFGLEAQG